MVSKKLTSLSVLCLLVIGTRSFGFQAQPNGIALAAGNVGELQQSQLVRKAEHIVSLLGKLPGSRPNASTKLIARDTSTTIIEWTDGPTLSFLDDGTLLLYSNPEFEDGRAQIEDVGQVDYQISLENLKSRGITLAKTFFGSSARVRSTTWHQPAIRPNPGKTYVEHLTLMIDELPEGLQFPTQGASAAITLNSNGQVVSIGASWINRKISAKRSLSLDAAIQRSKRFLESKDVSDIAIDPKTCGLGYVAPGKYFDAENHKQANRRNVRLAWRIPLGGQREIWIDAESGLIVGGKK